MIEPFNNINELDKAKLLKDLEAQTYHFKKNSSVLSAIIMEDVLGIVTNGSLQITKNDYNGNRIIIETVEENSIFGNNISFLSEDDYEVIAQQETTLIIFDYYQIINYKQYDCTYYDQFILNLLEITNSIITMRNERIRVLTQKTIRNKLLEYFNIYSKKYGSRIIYLPFSFTDFADYLAVDRSAMTRELKHLKEENIIDITSRRITLLYK